MALLLIPTAEKVNNEKFATVDKKTP